jgi:hypothetical protein
MQSEAIKNLYARYTKNPLPFQNKSATLHPIIILGSSPHEGPLNDACDGTWRAPLEQLTLLPGGRGPNMNTRMVSFLEPSHRSEQRCKVLAHPTLAPIAQNIPSYIPSCNVQ